MAIELEVTNAGTVELEVGGGTSAEWGGAEYVPITSIAATDYEVLDNKPLINGVTLQGNKTSEELGVRPIGNAAILELFRQGD